MLLVPLSLLGCAKNKPTAEECGRAWHHVEELEAAAMQAQVEADAEREGTAATPEMEQAREAMRASTRALADRAAHDPNMARFQSALNAACQTGSEATAKCVLGARSVDDLVKVCRMKASPGPRGGVSFSWPE